MREETRHFETTTTHQNQTWKTRRGAHSFIETDFEPGDAKHHQIHRSNGSFNSYCLDSDSETFSANVWFRISTSRQLQNMAFEVLDLTVLLFSASTKIWFLCELSLDLEDAFWTRSSSSLPRDNPTQLTKLMTGVCKTTRTKTRVPVTSRTSDVTEAQDKKCANKPSTKRHAG